MRSAGVLLLVCLGAILLFSRTALGQPSSSSDQPEQTDESQLANETSIVSGAAAASDTLADVIAGRNELSMFSMALNQAGLRSALSGSPSDLLNVLGGTPVGLNLTQGGNTSFTVFAPTNNALAALSPETASLFASSANLTAQRQLLATHIIPGTYNLLRLRTVSGQRLVSFSGSPILTLARRVQMPLLSLSNDMILLQPNASQQPQSTRFVFSYGNGFVVRSNLLASNGILQIIDAVQVPSYFYLNAPPNQTVAQILSSLPQHSLLPRLISTVIPPNQNPFQNTARVAQASSQGSDFQRARMGVTLFAPTDQALMAALSRFGLEANLSPSTSQNAAELADARNMLTSLLLNHVVPTMFFTVDLRDGQAFSSLANTTVQITERAPQPMSSQYFVNDGQIVQANIQATDGVIHSIDTVLITTLNNEQFAPAA